MCEFFLLDCNVLLLSMMCKEEDLECGSLFLLVILNFNMFRFYWVFLYLLGKFC